MHLSDDVLKEKIIDLQSAIEKWAFDRDLWTDSGFSSYQECFDDEPNKLAACVIVMHTEGGMFRMLNGYDDGSFLEEFHEFIETTEFYYEAYNHYQFCFY